MDKIFDSKIKRAINKFLYIIVFLLLVQNIINANEINPRKSIKNNFSISNSYVKITPLSSKENKKESVLNFKKYSKTTRLLLRNGVLFLSLSIIPLGASGGLIGGLIGYPLWDNYYRNQPAISDNYREVTGIVIAAIFGSGLFALGVYFIVVGIINLRKFLQAKKSDTSVSMFIRSDIHQIAKNKEYTISTGIAVKL